MTKYSYTEKEVKNRIQKEINDIKNFYKKPIVNWGGESSDTKKKYTEIIAKYLLEEHNVLDKLNDIKVLTRKKSYNQNHNGKTKNETSNRQEERICLNMWNNSNNCENSKTYDFIGKIIDYQTPLKNKRNDEENSGVGKIDLLSYNESEKTAFILECKIPKSSETLLRCVLEVFTYWRTVNYQKILHDFNLPSNTILRKAVFIYKDSKPYKDYKDEYIKKILKRLEVDYIVLNERNDIEEYIKWEDIKD